MNLPPRAPAAGGCCLGFESVQPWRFMTQPRKVVSEEQSPPKAMGLGIAAANAAVHNLMALGVLLALGVGPVYLHYRFGIMMSDQNLLALGTALGFCLVVLGIGGFALFDVLARRRTPLRRIWGAAAFVVAGGLLTNRFVAWRGLQTVQDLQPPGGLRRQLFATVSETASEIASMALCAAALMLSGLSVVVLNRALGERAAAKGVSSGRPRQRKVAVFSISFGAVVVTVLTGFAMQASSLHRASLVVTAVQVAVGVAGALVFRSLFVEAEPARTAAVKRQCSSFIKALAASHLLWSAFWLEVAQMRRWEAMAGARFAPSDELSALLTALEQVPFLQQVSPLFVGLVIAAPAAILLVQRLPDATPSRGARALSFAPPGVAALAFAVIFFVDKLELRRAQTYPGFENKEGVVLPKFSRTEAQSAIGLGSTDELMVTNDGVHHRPAARDQPSFIPADSLKQGDCSRFSSTVREQATVNVFIDRSVPMKDVQCVVAGIAGRSTVAKAASRYEWEGTSATMLALDVVDDRLPHPYSELMGTTKAVQVALAEKMPQTLVTITAELWKVQRQGTTQELTGTSKQRAEQLAAALSGSDQDVAFSADPSTRWDEFASAMMRSSGRPFRLWIEGISNQPPEPEVQEPRSEWGEIVGRLSALGDPAVAHLFGGLAVADTDGFLVLGVAAAEPDEIKKVLKRHEAMAATCIRRGRAANVRQHPDTLLQLEIGKDGTVQTSNAFPKGVATSTTDCILAGLMRSRYPTQNTTATVSLRLVFAE